MHTEELWVGGPRLIQREGVFRLGTDAVLLADFAAGFSARKACDLGCGSGVISLLLAAGCPGLSVDAVDINPEAVALTEENAALNGLEGRIRAINADIRALRGLLPAGDYDLVIANPPYFPSGSGKTAEARGIAIARAEAECSLADVTAAAGYLARWGGHVFIVQRPERLAELVRSMSEAGVEPKRMRLAAHRPGATPSLVLVEGVRGAKPGMRVEPTLYLTDENGGDSAEAKRIYRR